MMVRGMVLFHGAALLHHIILLVVILEVLLVPPRPVAGQVGGVYSAGCNITSICH